MACGRVAVCATSIVTMMKYVAAKIVSKEGPIN